MPEIVEGTLRLGFGQDVKVIKFDATQWHKKHMRSSLKAMDILATRPGTVAAAAAQCAHWWIEIKDCLGDEAANQTRMAPTELPEVKTTREWVKEKEWVAMVAVQNRKPFIVDELMMKLRDTLASMSIAAHKLEPELADFVILPRQKLTLVLLLCWEPSDVNEFKRLALRLKAKLDTALAPYGFEGVIVNEHGTVPGLGWTVTRLP
jgi:hypothetical protein